MILERLKNLWAWSAIDPFERRVWDVNMDVAKATNAELHQIKAQYQRKEAQIIYPNPMDEVLKNNPEASIDELYEAR